MKEEKARSLTGASGEAAASKEAAVSEEA